MPATDRFLGALGRGPILLDTAMGTRLISRGLGRGEASAWNLERPDDVLAVHRLDVDAGSGALLTNTFCAGRNWLDRFGLGARSAEINRRGAEIARAAAGPDRPVLGSIGPTARGDIAALIEQAEALVAAGVDAILLETHPVDGAEAAARALLGRFTTPVVVSLHDWPARVDAIARGLADVGVSAIGVNCVSSMVEALRVARALRSAVDLPLLVKPGPGLPGSFARAVPELLALGVRLMGGCCGTTEAHVAALRAGLSAATRSSAYKS